MPVFAINFFSIGIKDNILKNKKCVRVWIHNILKNENVVYKNGELNFIFCDDKYLLNINKKFLRKNTLTDVIAFDYSEEGYFSADIFISYERIKENANKYLEEPQTELIRVMAHGILHLAGYKDKTLESKKIMTKKEEEYIKMYLNYIKICKSNKYGRST